MLRPHNGRVMPGRMPNTAADGVFLHRGTIRLIRVALPIQSPSE